MVDMKLYQLFFILSVICFYMAISSYHLYKKFKKLGRSIAEQRKELNFTGAIVYASIATRENISLKAVLEKYSVSYPIRPLNGDQCLELSKIIPFSYDHIREAFPRPEGEQP